MYHCCTRKARRLTNAFYSYGTRFFFPQCSLQVQTTCHSRGGKLLERIFCSYAKCIKNKLFKFFASHKSILSKFGKTIISQKSFFFNNKPSNAHENNCGHFSFFPNQNGKKSLLGYSERTIRWHINKGRIFAILQDRKFLVSKYSLIKFLASR